MKVVHLRSALADEEREITFWNERAAGLGLEFFAAFEEAIEEIKNAPEGYFMVSREKQLRRFFETRFKTTILYQYLKEENRLRIVRVYNARMDPKRFQP